MYSQIENAVRIFSSGGIVIFPTDTAFGIGCRIDDSRAIEKLFKLRNRPTNQATPVLISDIEMALDYVGNIPEDVKEKLIDKFWPGALTIILPANLDKVDSLVRGGGNNVGIRIPNHKMILSIIKSLGVPILGPSANFHGGKTPYSMEDLDQKLVEKADLLVRGKRSIKEASTVIDCSTSPWKIIRRGAIELNL